MRNTDKVTLTTSMSISFDDFRDLIWDICGNSYDVEDDYGSLRFFRIDEDGEEIADEDADATELFVTERLEKYFEVTICNFRTVSEYGSFEVMIQYID